MQKGQLNLIRHAVKDATEHCSGPFCHMPLLRRVVLHADSPTWVYQQSLRFG